jgi:hypothetical protein
LGVELFGESGEFLGREFAGVPLGFEFVDEGFDVLRQLLLFGEVVFEVLLCLRVGVVEVLQFSFESGVFLVRDRGSACTK